MPYSFISKERIMLILQNILYKHPNKDVVFSNINLKINDHSKIALIGNNGVGKSTLLKLVAGSVKPVEGHIKSKASPYYIPQVFGQYNHLTVAQALRIEYKLNALNHILAGNVTESNLRSLDDDWTIETRCTEALNYWKLKDMDLMQKMETLSGGQKTKVFLAGILIHRPEFILMDEPSNHLDVESRELLYNFIKTTTATLMIVSHDRTLLNLLNTVCELTKQGIIVYGGNYDFYAGQKQIETDALSLEINGKERALRIAKEKERESLSRQQKLDARGKKKQEKAGVARIMMNTLRNNAENSTAKIKSAHSDKIEGISNELKGLRKELPDIDKMKFGFDNSTLHKGKVLITASHANYRYGKDMIWEKNITLQILSGERIALKGSNGSGKTTLINMILGELEPQTGYVKRANIRSVYIDQDYSLVNDQLRVYEQAQQFNRSQLQEHEIKTRLARFLFTADDWDKLCGILSGGEKMRLMLCLLTISDESPDVIVLDEPTNNLDMQNSRILTAAINEYRGTLIVVSHDLHFLDRIHIGRAITL
jgi:ATPase subunit of ABC transporter with duplicated ATPase domains